MADLNNQASENTPGIFFVDLDCIACDACILDASPFFEMNQTEGHAYLALQPIKSNDISICDEALANCPVEAIGKK